MYRELDIERRLKNHTADHGWRHLLRKSNLQKRCELKENKHFDVDKNQLVYLEQS